MERYKERRWDGEAMSTFACVVGWKRKADDDAKKRCQSSDLIPLNFKVYVFVNLRSLDET